MSRPSITEIADRLRISKSTVSRVFNNTPNSRISQATRDRVMAMVKDLGYEPNISARALAKARTHVIGVMFINICNPQVSEYVLAGETVASERGYHVILCNTRENADKEENECRMLRQRGAEGIIVEHSGSADHLRQLAQENYPIVLTGQCKEAPEISYVGFDEVLGARLGTEALIRRGHRKIVFLGYSREAPAITTRVKGYRLAMQKAGFGVADDWIYPIDNHENIEEAMTATEAILKQEELPDALFCYTDLVASGAYRAIRSKGLRVPEDIAIMGYGNMSFGPWTTAPFPSVHLDTALMGKKAMGLLLDRIEGGVDGEDIESFNIAPYVVREHLLDSG